MFRVLAAKMYFENPSAFGFNFTAEDLYPYIPVREEVTVNGPIESLVSFAEKHGVSYYDLKQGVHTLELKPNKGGAAIEGLVLTDAPGSFEPERGKF